MPNVAVTLDDDLVAILRDPNHPHHPLEEVVAEMVVLELYRRGAISGGKAGQLLGMNRWDFVRYASRLGIPYFRMSEEEWERERAVSESL